MKKTKPIIILLMICFMCVALASCSGEKYTVNYQTNGGEEILSASFDKDNLSSFTLPESPKKDGCIFIGWYFDNDTFLLPATNENVIEKFNSKIKSITIYAKWKVANIEEGTYLINFETNGGNSIASISTNQVEPNFIMPTNPTRNNFVFDNWYFDNGTFLEVATYNAILERLSQSSPYITVFAKWNDTSKDAFRNLGVSLDVFYSGINVSPTKPLDSDIERLGELELQFTKHLSKDKTLQENYNNVVYFWESFDTEIWDKFQTYKRYIELINIKNANGGLSPENQAELDLIASNDQDLASRTEQDNYEHTQFWVAIHHQIYDISKLELDILEEYRDTALVVLKYNAYFTNKDTFLENVDHFINSLTTNDIRGIKVNALADFLTFYDYSSLLIELIDEKQNTYFALDYSLFTSFLLDARDKCQLTKEDTGILFYRLLQTYLNSLVREINKEIVLINQDLELYYQAPSSYPDDYRNYLDGKLSFNLEKKQNFEDIKSKLNQNYITETLDLLLGVAEILNNNDLIETLFNPSPKKSVPELLEIATVALSIKTACDQLISTYHTGEFQNSINSLNQILTSLEENSNLDTTATLIKAILPSDPVDTLTKLSTSLSLITENNLSVFLTREFDEVEEVYSLQLNKNEYFDTNLYILEAKLLTALSGDNYNYDVINASYDKVINSLSQFLPYGLSYYNNIRNSFYNDTIMSRPISELIFNNIKSRFLISEENYAKIKEIAKAEFVTKESDPVPANLEVLPFVAEFQKLLSFMDITSSIEDSYLAIYNDRDFSISFANNSIGFAVLLYALDVDIDKLSSYSNYMSELADIFPDKEVNSKNVLLSYAFDGLFKDGCFTYEDIASICILFMEKGVEFVKDNIEFFGIEIEQIISLIETISSADDSTIEEICFVMINSLQLSSALTIVANGKINTVAELETAFASAREILSDFASASPDKWSQSIDTLKEILTTLKEIDETRLHAEFIEYFINTPTNSAIKLASIMALFDKNTLNYFVIDTENGLQINSENEFFFDNLAILEAKILKLLIDENNLDAFEIFYTHLVDYMKTNSNFLFASIFDTNKSSINSAFIEQIIDLFYENTKSSFVINETRYQAILSLSEKPFITIESTITEQDYENVIFANALKKLLIYNNLTDDILEAIDSLYLDSLEKQGYSNIINNETFTTLLITMYIHNMDTAKLEAFLDYLNNALAPYSESPFSQDNILTFFALISDGIIQSGFTGEEINLVVSNFGKIALAYLIDNGDIDAGKKEITIEAMLDFTSSLYNIAALFNQYNVLDFDEENALHKLYLDRLILAQTEFDAELNNLLQVFENEEKHNAFNAFFDAALHFVFQSKLDDMLRNILAEDYDATKLSFETQFNVILELIKVDFDIKGIVGKIQAIFHEYIEYSSAEFYLDNNLIVFKAKVVLLIFGENPQVKYNLAFETAANSEIVLEKVNAFLEVYYDIKILAGYTYNQESIDADALSRINVFIDIYLRNS